MLRALMNTSNVGGGARGGVHRSGTKTGTRFVRPSTCASSERSGRTCA